MSVYGRNAENRMLRIRKDANFKLTQEVAMPRNADPSAMEQIVELAAVEVAFTRGRKGTPIPEQAPAAFNALEAQLPTLKKKRFYGVVIDGEYRACVAVDDDTRGLDLPRWVIPSGRYAMRKIADWERHRDEIGPTVGAMRNRPDLDPSRPLVEFYRSQAELRLLAPVR
jgi:hypothetical protein